MSTDVRHRLIRTLDSGAQRVDETSNLTERLVILDCVRKRVKTKTKLSSCLDNLNDKLDVISQQEQTAQFV